MSYLDIFPDSLICMIVAQLDNIRDVLMIKRVSRRVEDIVYDSTFLLTSETLVKVKHVELINFKNLIMVSHNIQITITRPDDLKFINKMKNLEQINFNIGMFDSIKDTLNYLDFFLNNLPNKNLSGRLSTKTFRLLFTINNSGKSKSYAYIFDRGYFTLANSNQLRGIGANSFNIIYNDILDDINTIFKKYYPSEHLYICIYTPKMNKIFRDNNVIKINPFNINSTNKLINNSIFILHKIEGQDEIYHINDFVKELSKLSDSPIPYVNYKILAILLSINVGDKDIVIYQNEKIYYKVWDCSLFNKYFNKQTFIQTYDNLEKTLLKLEEEGLTSKDLKYSLLEENKAKVSQFLNNKVEIESLISFILVHCYPLDIVKKQELHKLVLPLKKTYLL